MTVSVPVYLLEADADRVSYKVVKDSGDDPDVTNGTDVCVTVAYVKQRVCEQKMEAKTGPAHLPANHFRI